MENRDVTDDEWGENFRTLCNGLEVIYAMMLEEDRWSLTDNEKELVFDVVQQMKVMIFPIVESLEE